MSELVPWWLELRCSRGTIYFPLRLLAQGRRDDPELQDVLPVCGVVSAAGTPASVEGVAG